MMSWKARYYRLLTVCITLLDGLSAGCVVQDEDEEGLRKAMLDTYPDALVNKKKRRKKSG